MQSSKNRSGSVADMCAGDSAYNALLAEAIRQVKWEKRFPRDHRIFLAGLIAGLTVMKLVAYVS